MPGSGAAGRRGPRSRRRRGTAGRSWRTRRTSPRSRTTISAFSSRRRARAAALIPPATPPTTTILMGGSSLLVRWVRQRRRDGPMAHPFAVPGMEAYTPRGIFRSGPRSGVQRAARVSEPSKAPEGLRGSQAAGRRATTTVSSAGRGGSLDLPTDHLGALDHQARRAHRRRDPVGVREHVRPLRPPGAVGGVGPVVPHQQQPAVRRHCRRGQREGCGGPARAAGARRPAGPGRTRGARGRPADVGHGPRDVARAAPRRRRGARRARGRAARRRRRSPRRRPASRGPRATASGGRRRRPRRARGRVPARRRPPGP